MTTDELRVTIVPRAHETRILMTEGPDDVLVERDRQAPPHGRKTGRKILGRHCAPPKPAGDPRGSILDPYEPAIRAVLDDTPEMLAPAVLERLRPLGYTGGVTILRDRHAAAAPPRTTGGVPDPRLRAWGGRCRWLGRHSASRSPSRLLQRRRTAQGQASLRWARLAART